MSQNQNYFPPEARCWKRRFLVIVSGQTISLIGSSAVQFALIWWLASKSSSAMVLSLAGLFAFLPQLILGPFAGVWIDRMKRKTVIIAADLFMALAALVFALLFVFGEPPYWAAYTVLCLRAVGGVFHTPAMQAAVPMPGAGRAVGARERLEPVSAVGRVHAGAGAGCGAVRGAGDAGDFTDRRSGCAGRVRQRRRSIHPRPAETGARSAAHPREMKEGAAVLLRDRRLFVVTIAATLCMVFYLPLSSLYPLMTSDYFAGTAWHASIIEFVYAGGMMLCAAIVSARGEIKTSFA